MSSLHQPFFFLALFFFLHQATSSLTCLDTCDPTRSEPSIRFPFRREDQNIGCGYPGFELSCNHKNQTILSLPDSGRFIVQKIDYLSQTILISDPNSCLPRRFTESFKLTNTPFVAGDAVVFKFFNCSSNANNVPTSPRSRVIDCMSGDDFTVVALPEYWYNESGQLRTLCNEFDTVAVPVLWPSWSQLEHGFFLKWNLPVCKFCEERGRSCGLKNDKSPVLQIGCNNLPSRGLPRSAKYGMIIGVAIPGLLCLIGIACCLCGRARDYYDRRRHSDTEVVSRITPQSVVIITGLDKTTIESFPKTLLGESKRLPKPNDNICSICLCDYQPKETLRTIPECSHYFHANCIDEWLKLTATCPVCRNSPEDSAAVTPSTSTSFSSSSSSILSP